MLTDSSLAIDEVIKAVSDGKSAIRYFVKDRATVNHYRIDTNNIFIGGNSAGAVLYMHVGYLDSFAECPTDIKAAMTANGGFEGNSGNAGYTTKSKAIINLAGALNQVAFAGIGDKPSVNAQGDADAVVPYTCGLPYIGFVHVPVTLCGLGSLEARYDSMSIPHMSHVFPGQGHVPWSTDAGMFVTVDSMVQLFLYNQLCSNTGVQNINIIIPEISLYPNPANEILNFTSTEIMKTILVYDELGRIACNINGLNLDSYQLNTSRLPKGVYLVKVVFNDGNNAPVLKRVLID